MLLGRRLGRESDTAGGHVAFAIGGRHVADGIADGIWFRYRFAEGGGRALPCRRLRETSRCAQRHFAEYINLLVMGVHLCAGFCKQRLRVALRGSTPHTPLCSFGR